MRPPRVKVAVILTPEEHERIKEMAGLVPLSAWFRALALPAKLEVKTCKHGLLVCKKCA